MGTHTKVSEIVAHLWNLHGAWTFASPEYLVKRMPRRVRRALYASGLAR